LVKDFYTRFKEAYEERNDSRVISMISDQWQAGDGTTLADLQTTLRRTFKTFDEIRYSVQNISITPLEGDRYRVSYDVTITSRIYKRNLKHEEKSSINEEVTIDRSGKPKISKTLGGRFWTVR
jgi:murein L,D-transpeptidase YafK